MRRLANKVDGFLFTGILPLLDLVFYNNFDMNYEKMYNG